MSDLDLSRLTIARAAQALRARELSPLELTESYLRRIERLEPARERVHHRDRGARARRRAARDRGARGRPGRAVRCTASRSR